MSAEVQWVRVQWAMWLMGATDAQVAGWTAGEEGDWYAAVSRAELARREALS